MRNRRVPLRSRIRRDECNGERSVRERREADRDEVRLCPFLRGRCGQRSYLLAFPADFNFIHVSSAVVWNPLPSVQRNRTDLHQTCCSMTIFLFHSHQSCLRLTLALLNLWQLNSTVQQDERTVRLAAAS